MTTERLANATQMGTVDLLVRDLEGLVDYYTTGVGLEILEVTGPVAVLGRGTAPLLRLSQDRNLPGFDRGDAGLFHTAILFDTKTQLANSVTSTYRLGTGRFTGSSDHHVSEAFYFDDPEGNGLELYVDRPREAWDYAPNGEVKMVTEYLDPNAFLATHGDESATDTGASVGHVHLQVGDIPTAEAFYSRLLGFDVTARYGTQALFLAAGGYHHHIGVNTWNSGGAGPRAASLGLGFATIDVPDAGELDRIAARLTRGGAEHERRSDDEFGGSLLRVRDPWGTWIQIRAAA